MAKKPKPRLTPEEHKAKTLLELEREISALDNIRVALDAVEEKSAKRVMKHIALALGDTYQSLAREIIQLDALHYWKAKREGFTPEQLEQAKRVIALLSLSYKFYRKSPRHYGRAFAVQGLISQLCEAIGVPVPTVEEMEKAA